MCAPAILTRASTEDSISRVQYDKAREREAGVEMSDLFLGSILSSVLTLSTVGHSGQKSVSNLGIEYAFQ